MSIDYCTKFTWDEPSLNGLRKSESRIMSMLDFNRELSVRLIFLVFVAWFLLDVLYRILSSLICTLNRA